MGKDITYIAQEEDSGVFYCTRGRRGSHSFNKYKVDSYILQDLLIVLEFFRKYQPEPRFVRKWEIPALSRFIRVAIFRDSMHPKRARDIATMCIQLSMMVGEIL